MICAIAMEYQFICDVSEIHKSMHQIWVWCMRVWQMYEYHYVWCMWVCQMYEPHKSITMYDVCGSDCPEWLKTAHTGSIVTHHHHHHITSNSDGTNIFLQYMKYFLIPCFTWKNFSAACETLENEYSTSYNICANSLNV